MHIQFIHVQQCIQISTRINSSNVHMYILRLFYIASSIRISILIDSFSNGLLTNNSTWCQNRGCICISSTRRTYGRIHMHPAYIQTSTIILQTELFTKKRREKIQGEILQSSSSTVFPHRIHPFYMQSGKFPVIPCQDNYSTYRINSTTRNLQEILQLQGSSRAD